VAPAWAAWRRLRVPAGAPYDLRVGRISKMPAASHADPVSAAKSSPAAHDPLSVCIFAGASCGDSEAFSAAARGCVAAIAAAGGRIVYGAGGVGLMGVVADEAISRGVPIVGVFPSFLLDREAPHAGLTEVHVVESLHARKSLMAGLSNAVVALPGGFGTLEEFVEAVTWTQLGLQAKPCGLLNVEGYYDGLLAFFDAAAARGFVGERDSAIVLCDTSATSLIERLIAALDQAPANATISSNRAAAVVTGTRVTGIPALP
jgi:uncharacterized protein (TIGR00730 family)